MDIFRVSFIGHRVVDEYRQVEEELDEVIELLHRKYGFISKFPKRMYCSLPMKTERR